MTIGYGGQILPQGLFGGAFLPFAVDPLTTAAMYGNGHYGTNGHVAPQSVLFAQNTIDPEAQASQDFLKAATGCVIPQLGDYVRTHTAEYTPLADVAPLITRAAEFFKNRDYPRAYLQAYQAYRSIAMLRSRLPGLPSL